jgi:DnaD/phage-associated family protein
LEEEEEEYSSGIDIFKLYEENFGRLTPLIKGALIQARLTYPDEWIRDAMIVAVKQNNRRWKYIEGILKNWQMFGKTD